MTQRFTVLVPAVVLLSVVALGRAEEAQPPDARAEVRLAEQAMNLLQQHLQARLLAALADRGPAGAVQVCRVAAREITERVAREFGIELGRTSHRLRNPANAPRSWVRPYLERAAGKPAREVEGATVDLGERIGVLRPIVTGGPCLLCHGPAETLDPNLKAVLTELYPHDRATGFREGEFRGFFWAEVNKQR